MRIRHLSLAALVALTGCSKKDAPPAPGADAAIASADAAVSPTASGSAGPATKSSGAKTFVGKYTVAPATMYIPSSKDWSSAKFKNDESKLLGDGELTLAIDADGRVTGSTDGGPLGASALSGKSEGDTVTATVRRKDAKEDGLTGTLLAKLSGDKLEGTMNLSDGQSVAVRAATFTLAKK